MFLTPTRIKGEVSSKGGRIEGETKPDSYTGRSSDPVLILGETNDPTPMQKVFQIEHK